MSKDLKYIEFINKLTDLLKEYKAEIVSDAIMDSFGEFYTITKISVDGNTRLIADDGYLDVMTLQNFKVEKQGE